MHPAPRADLAAASVQRSMRRGVSTHGAQPPADTRWRRDQIHFSPDRALGVSRRPSRLRAVEAILITGRRCLPS